MKRLVAFLVVILLSSLMPDVASQIVPSTSTPPVVITAINVTRAPVVNVPTSSIVTVHNPSDIQQSVTVVWSYDDQLPLNDQAPTAAYNQESQVIDGNSDWTFTLVFTPDERHAGKQSIVVRANGATGPSSGASILAYFPIFVANPSLRLRMDTAPFPGLFDGGVGFFKFYVENDGNANETPNVTWLPDPNFNVTILANFSTILPYNIGQGIVLVRPLTSNESINLSSTLTVNSSLDPTISLAEPMPTLHVNETLVFLNASFDVTPLPSSIQVPPGETRSLDFNVTNTGGVDDVYNVTATVLPADAGVNAALALAPASANLSLPQDASYVIGLHPNETVSLRALVGYNETRGDGNVKVTLLVRSANADLLAPRHPAEGAGIARTTIVSPAAPEPALVGLVGPIDAYPTDVGYFHVVVVNRGLLATMPSVVSVVIEDDLQVAFTTDVAFPALAPGETDSLPFYAPLSSLRGSFAVVGTLKPHPNDKDADPTDNVLSVPLYVRAPALSLDAPQQITVTPGGRLTILGGSGSFLLKNRGDRDEEFDVKLTAPGAPWLEHSWHLIVPSGLILTLPLEVDVPAFVGASSFIASVHAELRGHASYHDDTNVTVVTNAVRSPTIALGPLADGLAHHPYVIQAQLEDAIGILSAEARIRRPDGIVDIVALSATSANTWSATYTPSSVGNFSVEVHAVAAGDPQRTSTSNVSWTVGAPAYAGVVPVGFEDHSRIGNTTLTFEDAQDGTTRSLYVDIGAGPQLAPHPYVVQAPFWRDGPHVVGLNATSVDGAEWHATLHVKLDRTPPTLAHPNVRVDAYGRIFLSVTVPDASKVTARIQTPSGPIDVPLTRTLVGDYGASIEAPSQWSSVEFLSIGTNGVQSSVVLSSASDHPLPFGSWLVLAAAAIGALALRRARRP